MKKLMFAAFLACAMCVFADDPASKPANDTDRKPPMAERQKLTPEQRKAFHEKMMAARKARQAEIQSKVVAALKEAGLTDEQAKTTADKIEEIYMSGRRPMGPRHPGGPRRPGGPRPPQAKPAK